MLLVIALTALMLVAAGCGDDEENGGGGGGGGATTEESSGGGGGESGVSDNPQVQAAVDSCKQAIQAQPTLSADVKSDLEDICEKAGSGDIKDAQQAAKEVCEKIVDESVPEGAARDQAKQACAAAGGG